MWPFHTSRRSKKAACAYAEDKIALEELVETLPTGDRAGSADQEHRTSNCSLNYNPAPGAVNGKLVYRVLQKH